MYRWLIGICNGLQYLHGVGENGIMHRDVKPENILITVDNNVKICDLGLAVNADYSSYTHGVGTQLYKPNEQIEGNYSKFVDVFPCGRYI